VELIGAFGDLVVELVALFAPPNGLDPGAVVMVEFSGAV